MNHPRVYIVEVIISKDEAEEREDEDFDLSNIQLRSD